MTVATLILAGLAALAAVGALLEARHAREPRGLVGRSVLVSTTGSTAVRGVVHAELEDRLTLRDAAVITVGADAEVPAGGLLHMYRERIDLVQELPARPAIAAGAQG